MSVYIEHKKGELVGQEGDLWLVDTGEAIVRSRHEPVTHAHPEGWYMREGKPVLVSHYTAWVRDGKLTPVYQYKNFALPPFGSNCLYEKEMSTLTPAANPYLPPEDVEEKAGEFDAKLIPLKKQLRELQQAIAATESERKKAMNAICQHDWQKDGDEEETGKSGFGTSFKQEWVCEACGISHTSYYTRLG